MKKCTNRILFAVGKDIYEGFNVLTVVVDVMFNGFVGIIEILANIRTYFIADVVVGRCACICEYRKHKRVLELCGIRKCTPRETVLYNVATATYSFRFDCSYGMAWVDICIYIIIIGPPNLSICYGITAPSHRFPFKL